MKKPPAKRSPQPNSPQPNHTHVSVQHMASMWKAPLPPPDVLEEFNRVVDNGAERIVKAWEIESEHRRSIDRRDQRMFYVNAILGKIFAFLFVMAALALSAWALYLDRPWLAGILAGTTLASVVGAFLEIEKRKPK